MHVWNQHDSVAHHRLQDHEATDVSCFVVLKPNRKKCWMAASQCGVVRLGVAKRNASACQRRVKARNHAVLQSWSSLDVLLDIAAGRKTKRSIAV